MVIFKDSNEISSTEKRFVGDLEAQRKLDEIVAERVRNATELEEDRLINDLRTWVFKEMRASVSFGNLITFYHREIEKRDMLIRELFADKVGL